MLLYGEGMTIIKCGPIKSSCGRITVTSHHSDVKYWHHLCIYNLVQALQATAKLGKFMFELHAVLDNPG